MQGIFSQHNRGAEPQKEMTMRRQNRTVLALFILIGVLAAAIAPNPTWGARQERASFEEGILRAGQLESTCDDCADVTDGSPVPGELDPVFPQSRTNS